MRRMYVAALAHPLSVEYLLLDPAQYALAEDHAEGLFAFVARDPVLRGRPRFTSIATLRRRFPEHRTIVARDLDGVLRETEPPRRGSGSV
jgi:hypothetical protein